MSEENITTREDETKETEESSEESVDEVETEEVAGSPESSSESTTDEVIDLADRFNSKSEADKPKSDTVSLSKYQTQREKRIEAENKVKELEGVVSELKDPSSADISKIADEYDVDAELVESIVGITEARLKKTLDDKVGKVERLAAKTQAEKSYNKAFEKEILSIYPQLKGKREQIKALCVTPQYRKTPLVKIAEELFSGMLGKTSSESATRPSIESGENIDFARMDAETKSKVMKDPKMKKEYFSWLDENETLSVM
tara:strand:+ start:9637 stop:10410 length:774 start_codon:yes stop_codon:yes gene_type:complete